MDTIKVKQKDATVRLEVEGVCGWTVYFSHTFSDNLYAELAAKEMIDGLETLVENIRQHSYELGWSDAKAHRTKAKWFSSLLRR